MAEKDMVMSHLRIVRTWAGTPSPLEMQRIDNSECGKVTEWMDDALKFLEPVPPIHEPNWQEGFYECGCCRRRVFRESDNYCSKCGKEIKWNE